MYNLPIILWPTTYRLLGIYDGYSSGIDGNKDRQVLARQPRPNTSAWLLYLPVEERTPVCQRRSCEDLHIRLKMLWKTNHSIKSPFNFL